MSPHYYQVIGVLKVNGRTAFRAFGRYPSVEEMRNVAEKWATETAGAAGYIMKRRRWRERACDGLEVSHGR